MLFPQLIKKRPSIPRSIQSFRRSWHSLEWKRVRGIWKDPGKIDRVITIPVLSNTVARSNCVPTIMKEYSYFAMVLSQETKAKTNEMQMSFLISISCTRCSYPKVTCSTETSDEMILKECFEGHEVR